MTTNKPSSIGDFIKSWFDYDATKDEITWKEWVSPDWYKYKAWHDKFMSEKAGRPVKFSNHKKGFFYLMVVGRTILAHHIVWVITYGSMPEHQIDHIDGNPKNNHIDNLRDVPAKINLRNRKMYQNNSSGVTGVHWSNRERKWYSRVMIDSKYVYLGIFDTVDEAAKAREEFLAKNCDAGFTERHGRCKS